MSRRRANGEGSVWRCSDGRWEGRAFLPPDAAGRVRRHAVYGRTKAEVVERMLTLRTDAARGVLPDPERATVRTACGGRR